MDFKPGDFFLGLMDFFTILLPGALLAYWQKISLRVTSSAASFCLPSIPRIREAG